MSSMEVDNNDHSMEYQSDYDVLSHFRGWIAEYRRIQEVIPELRICMTRTHIQFRYDLEFELLT
jgi:hypothetical protein